MKEGTILTVLERRAGYTVVPFPFNFGNMCEWFVTLLSAVDHLRERMCVCLVQHVVTTSFIQIEKHTIRFCETNRFKVIMHL